jgi:hypothetical protein
MSKFFYRMCFVLLSIGVYAAQESEDLRTFILEGRAGETVHKDDPRLSDTLNVSKLRRIEHQKQEEPRQKELIERP